MRRRALRQPGSFTSVSTTFYAHGGNGDDQVTLDVQSVAGVDTGDGVLVRTAVSSEAGEKTPASVTVASAVAQEVETVLDMMDSSASAAAVDGVYYVGTSADVSEKAEAATGAVNVLAGDVTLENVADGVTVSNSGQGTVSVNGSVVASGDTVEVHVHQLTHVAAKAPTETEDGNIEYWHCEGCNSYFLDEAMTREIDQAETIVAATGTTTEPEEEPEATDPAQTTEPEDTTTDGDAETTVPQTSDNGNLGLWFALLAASLGGVTGAALLLKKRRAQYGKNDFCSKCRPLKRGWHSFCYRRKVRTHNRPV